MSVKSAILKELDISIYENHTTTSHPPVCTRKGFSVTGVIRQIFNYDTFLDFSVFMVDNIIPVRYLHSTRIIETDSNTAEMENFQYLQWYQDASDLSNNWKLQDIAIFKSD